MTTSDYHPALDTAVAAAAEAAAILLAECNRPGGPRGAHGHCDADAEAERAIRARLTASFPAWGFVGEETGTTLPAGAGHVWLVDPNDGTDAMLQGYRGSAVSIALLREGVPMLGVVHAVNAPDDGGDRFAWAEGCGPLTRNGRPVEQTAWPSQLRPHDVVFVSHRAMPSIAYRLALVAAGEGAAAVSLNSPSGWDYAAGHALLRAAGGLFVDERGEPVHYTAHGRSHMQYCFGGAPAVVRALAQRPWATVFGSGFGEAAPAPGYGPVRLAPGRLVNETPRLRRAQGCLLGQLAGDSLGSLVEFLDPATIARRYPDGPSLLADGGTWDTVAGQPTDDSELALTLARSIVAAGDFDGERVAAGYARWYHGWTHDAAPVPCSHAWCRPFDVGSTTSKALGAVRAADVTGGTAARAAMAAADHASQANGALMRISPLGIWGAGRDPQQVAAAARADARLTHPNAICQEASALFAVTLAHAIHTGADAGATFDFAVEWARSNALAAEIGDTLAAARSRPPDDFLTYQGWVLVALQNAFFRLVHTPSLEDGVATTVRAGGDTDTNATICGALLGAVHGRASIPDQWRRMVLSCRPMPGHPHIRRPRPAQFWPTDALPLAERLLLCA